MIPSLEAPSGLGLLRCVGRDEEGERCRGRLAEAGERLACEGCGRHYPLVAGVAVLRPRGEGDGWFEAMYAGRSRTEQLQTDYLRAERAFMAGFAAEKGLAGPCLEVGCGVGLFADLVPGFVGLEYSLQSLLAPGFESADRVCGDAAILPFGDGSMECVSSFNTLEHVEEVGQAFAEMHRVLKPGGYLVLKPAWHCTRYTTELIPVLPYRDLDPGQKVVKALLPVLKSRPFKAAMQLPWRASRRLTARRDNPLRWGRLTPYHGEAWIADADAVASLDCHEGILYFLSRGYSCLSHPSALRQLLAGHDVVVMRKPAS